MKMKIKAALYESKYKEIKYNRGGDCSIVLSIKEWRIFGNYLSNEIMGRRKQLAAVELAVLHDYIKGIAKLCAGEYDWQTKSKKLSRPEQLALSSLLSHYHFDTCPTFVPLIFSEIYYHAEQYKYAANNPKHP